jgi:hypothetical protein
MSVMLAVPTVLVPMAHADEYIPWPTASCMKAWHRTNFKGFDECLVRISNGKRSPLLVDVTRLNVWAHTHNILTDEGKRLDLAWKQSRIEL